jgi:hypothetical protein
MATRSRRRTRSKNRSVSGITIVEGRGRRLGGSDGSILDRVVTAAKKVPWWGWTGLLGGGALLWYYFMSTPKEVTEASGTDAKYPDIFAAALPSHARAYAPIILQIADEQNVDPFLIAAIGTRESQWGAAIGGPGGTGDGGHGRGIMQIDDRSNQVWLATNDWTDPYTNITKGVEIFKAKVKYLTAISIGSVTLDDTHARARGVAPGNYPDPRPLSGDWLVRCATAAYNTGEHNVLMSIAAGADPDATTTGHNYSSDVLAHMDTYASAYRNSAPA